MGQEQQNVPGGSGRFSYSALLHEEAEYRNRFIQLATRRYREVLDLDVLTGRHLQRMVTETPEPTLAFRMDSKSKKLDRSNFIKPVNLFLYVPVDASPEELLPKLWSRVVDPDHGSHLSLAVSQDEVTKEWVRKETGPEIPKTEDPADEIFDLIEHEYEELSSAVDGLKFMIRAVRDDYNIVEYRS